MNTPQTNISLDKTTGLKCECGNDTFTEALMLRKASKFLTGTAQDGLIPIPIFICVLCKAPLKATIPLQLRESKEE